ncbi:hypothetical protein, partial [Nostoc sp.]|uniref:hypothetical protein n=1 Tax=Nostoc sp. TaxID=1180 RepID=UPI002FF2CF6F
FLSGISNASSFEIPTTVKTVAASGDYFIGIDSSGELYKISKANLLAGLSSEGGGDNSGGENGNNGITLTFTSNGDSEGLFYYLGTSGLTTTWSNPVAGSSLIVTASTTEGGTVASLSDRIASEWYSNIAANNWVKYQITTGKLICNHYSIRSRSNNVDYYPRNWQLQGSNDGTNWAVLDEQVNNTDISSVSQWLSLPVTPTTAYSYFRLLQNGIDSSGVGYLCLGEVELYGEYIPS